MPDDPQSFSHGIDNALRFLRAYPQAAGQKSYPPALTRETAWGRDEDHLLEWFVRCVDEAMRGNPEHWRIEEDLGLFALVEWGDRRRLTYANVQVLRTEGLLEDFYVEAADAVKKGQEHIADALFQRCIYLRLDYDARTIAPMYSHPVPHIHTRPKGAPRLRLSGAPTSNVVMDFLELVYRQFYHPTWTAWARRVWLSDPSNDGLKTAEEEFDHIVRAFENADVGLLGQSDSLLDRMRRAFTDAKYRAFNTESDRRIQELTTYP